MINDKKKRRTTRENTEQDKDKIEVVQKERKKAREKEFEGE
jgi:hypothetical protein